MDTAIQIINARIEKPGRILFITGAGISAGSGLPTYRGLGGLDESLESDGMTLELALSGFMLFNKPDITWRHLATIIRACAIARPNPAHRLIAALEASHEVVVLTLNVDGLHQAAGSSKVIDIHNGIRRFCCMDCGQAHELAPAALEVLPPRCPCGGVVRPDIILYGEALDQAKVEDYQRELEKGFDLVCAIGTSQAFPYVLKPIQMMRRRGALTVEINPAHTALSGLVDLCLRQEAIPAMATVWPMPSAIGD